MFAMIKRHIGMGNDLEYVVIGDWPCCPVAAEANEAKVKAAIKQLGPKHCLHRSHSPMNKDWAEADRQAFIRSVR